MARILQALHIGLELLTYLSAGVTLAFYRSAQSTSGMAAMGHALMAWVSLLVCLVVGLISTSWMATVIAERNPAVAHRWVRLLVQLGLIFLAAFLVGDGV